MSEARLDAAYAQCDSELREHDRDRWLACLFALAVGNVFDKRTVVANTGILWRPLDPRTMKLTVTKSW